MEINLSKKEINYALFGLALGDGSYKSGVIYIEHTNKQNFYVQWIEELCISLNIKYEVKYDYLIRNTTFGKATYSMIKIWVPDRRHFEASRIIDDQKKKVISNYVLQRITPLGLLLWYLDDGQLHVSFKGTSAKRFAYLNTQSFSKFENKKIQDMLVKRFGIITSLHKDGSGLSNHRDKEYYRIYINATNFRIFFDLMRPYLLMIPNDFRYKFDMQYRPNRLKNSAEFAEKYNLE